MEKINIYEKAYHWEYSGFEEYIYLYPLEIIKKYLGTDYIGMDIGCGDCRITSALAKTIKEVYGIDNQRKPLQFARQLVKAKNMILTQADCLHLPFKDSTFDVAFMFDVIEHIPFAQITQLLNEVCRILKKNGFMFLTTPNRKNTFRSKGKIPEKHHFELSYKEILPLLRNHNLKLIEVKGVYPRPFPKKWHRHIKKRKYLYATMIKLGRWFPYLCDTFVVVTQC